MIEVPTFAYISSILYNIQYLFVFFDLSSSAGFQSYFSYASLKSNTMNVELKGKEGFSSF